MTDHRLTGEGRSFNLESVLSGALDPMLDALIAQNRAERLQAVHEEAES